MPVRVIPHAPRARCYKCGVTGITSVCHHCGRPTCDLHTAKIETAPKTAEFSDLSLGEDQGTDACGEFPFHCDDCQHAVKSPSWKLFVPGIVLGFAGIVALAKGVVAGLIGLLIGGGLVVLADYINRQRRAAMQRNRPLLPLLPRFESVRVREVLKGRLELDREGKYTTSSYEAKGRVIVDVVYGEPDRKRLQQYIKKYRLTDASDVQYHCGYVALQGQVGTVSDNHRSNGRASSESTVIKLTGNVSSHPYAGSRHDDASPEETVKIEYNLLQPIESLQIPLRVVPSLRTEGSQQVLGLELQWGGAYKMQLGLKPQADARELRAIEMFVLIVPASWGAVETVSDGAVVGGVSELPDRAPFRQIIWKRPPVEDSQRETRRRPFFVRFEKEIRLDHLISGEVRLSFSGSLSGIQGAKVFYPLGRPHRDALVQDVIHFIEGAFSLSLAGLRYQNVRVVPDTKRETDKEKEQTRVFPGVMPDYETVIALTNRMSEELFYVKGIVENPPRAGATAEVVSRLWDIIGRHYEGVYPVDFHLILGGELSSDPPSGVTRITLTVQGAYANQKMEEEVENVWERLNGPGGLIDDVMSDIRRRRPASEATFHQPDSAEEPVAVPFTSNESTSNRTTSEQASSARTRLDKLIDQFLDGRISEAIYLDLKTRLEAELG